MWSSPDRLRKAKDNDPNNSMKTKSIIRSAAPRAISLLVRAALGLTAVCAPASDPGDNRTVSGRLLAPLQEQGRHQVALAATLSLISASPRFPPAALPILMEFYRSDVWGGFRSAKLEFGAVQPTAVQRFVEPFGCATRLGH
jgi:hypothetical protein